MSVQYLDQSMQDYLRVEQAIVYIEQHFQCQPSLDEIAQQLGLSPYHFHRLFKRWAGITPKQFMQFLTIGYAKQLLAESQSVLAASFEAGLSGPGRLHDLFVTFEAISPGEYKNLGAGLRIDYGFQPSPFGECLLATTSRGVCNLLFVPAGQRAEALAELKQTWPLAQLAEDPAHTRQVAQKIFSSQPESIPLLVKGTNFQIKVWEALLKIPAGAVVNYGQVAASIGHPLAARAVANAIGQNPIGYLIPCHRVITRAGNLGGYHWGRTRKMAIFAREAGFRLS